MDSYRFDESFSDNLNHILEIFSYCMHVRMYICVANVCCIFTVYCNTLFSQSALRTVLDMEELPHWFDTGHFTVTQLIPVRNLSSRSTETSYNSDTISYYQNRPTKAVWRVLRDVLNHLDLESFATTYITLPPKQEQQEIIIRRYGKCLIGLCYNNDLILEYGT